jgi:hypothetical protein
MLTIGVIWLAEWLFGGATGGRPVGDAEML